jgi:hypothetical protein
MRESIEMTIAAQLVAQTFCIASAIIDEQTRQALRLCAWARGRAARSRRS